MAQSFHRIHVAGAQGGSKQAIKVTAPMRCCGVYSLAEVLGRTVLQRPDLFEPGISARPLACKPVGNESDFEP